MAGFKVAMVHLDAEELPSWVTETMAEHDIEFVFEECETRAQLAACAGDADVVWVCGGSPIVTAENIADLARCGAIIRTGSGTDNIPIEAATERGIVVANTPEAFNDGVSDHTIGLLLGVVRQIGLQDRLVRKGIWDREAGYPSWHLQGQTLGLIGFGHIARLVNRKLSGYEMNVLAHDPYVSAEVMAEHGVQKASMEDVLVAVGLRFAPLSAVGGDAAPDRRARAAADAAALDSDQHLARAGRGRGRAAACAAGGLDRGGRTGRAGTGAGRGRQSPVWPGQRGL